MSEPTTATPPAEPTATTTPATTSAPVTPPATRWIDDLPEDLRKEASFSNVKGDTWKEAGPVIAKSFIEAKKLVGADKIAIPGKNATPEEINAYQMKLGRPETPDKYSLPDLKLPDGKGLDQDRINRARERAFKAGVPDSAFKELVAFQAEEEMAIMQKAEADKVAALRESEEALKTEWGQKYQMKLELARAAATKFGDEKLTKFLEANPQIDSNPDFVRFLAKIGEGMLEDSSVGSGKNQIVLSIKAKAQGEIVRMKSDEAFMKRFLSGDKDAVKHWNEQFRLAESPEK